jgi:uncharacterized protein (TIGR02996 family)
MGRAFPDHRRGWRREVAFPAFATDRTTLWKRPAVSDDDPFLRAIIAKPGDDAPRLVYADWLDENGRPERAEFIRVQLALARLPDGDPLRSELQGRERELLARHEHEWTRPLQGLVVGWTFRRGFVEEVFVSGTVTPDLLRELRFLAPVGTVTHHYVGGGD